MSAGALKDIRHIRLEPAENGWTLSFTEVRKPMTGSSFDETDWVDRELVYTDDQTDLAFEKLKEIHMFKKGVKAGNAGAVPDLTAPAKIG